MLSIGAMCLISVVSNVVPKEVCNVYKLYLSGKSIEANALQERLLPLIEQMFTEVNPIPVKKAISLIGLGSSTLRPPLTELEPHNVKTLTEALKAFGFKVK
jgi:4-hydroxy-tetrahydrodipicolinate synthase